MLLLMFDLDGTLIDSRRDLCAAVNFMRSELRLPPLPVDRVASYVGDGARKLIERSLHGEKVDFDAAFTSFYGHYEKHLTDKTTLYPGVANGLEALHQAGHRLAVITNKPTGFSRQILEHFELIKWVDCLMGGDDTPHLKPHPEPLLTVLRKLEIEPASAWMMGDHKTDLEAARRAGVHRGFVTWGIGEKGTETAEKEWNDFAQMTRFFIPGESNQ